MARFNVYRERGLKSLLEELALRLLPRKGSQVNNLSVPTAHVSRKLAPPWALSACNGSIFVINVLGVCRPVACAVRCAYRNINWAVLCHLAVSTEVEIIVLFVVHCVLFEWHFLLHSKEPVMP